MHKQRILTAIIAGPLLFVIIWWGNVDAFNILAACAGAGLLLEYYGLCFGNSWGWKLWGTAISVIPLIGACLFLSESAILIGLYIALIASVASVLFFYKTLERPFEHWAKLGLGILYLGMSISFIVLLRALPLGKRWILFYLVVIFAGDSGAYYTGRSIGKHKLCPSISKGKTVEGAVGGVVSNFVAAMLLWYLLLPSFNIWKLALMASFVGLIGQIGDLAASTIKRSVGAKDSGKLLPGHGGLLDRLDAVVLAVPAFYFIVLLTVHFLPGIPSHTGAW